MSDIVCNDQCLVNGKDITCCFRPFLFPINVKIKIQEIIPFNRIVWSAEKKGLFAFHEFFFQEGEKGVLVTSKETLSGLLTSAGGLLLPEKRMRSLTKIFLKDLKKASEIEDRELARKFNKLSIDYFTKLRAAMLLIADAQKRFCKPDTPLGDPAYLIISDLILHGRGIRGGAGGGSATARPGAR